MCFIDDMLLLAKQNAIYAFSCWQARSKNKRKYTLVAMQYTYLAITCYMKFLLATNGFVAMIDDISRIRAVVESTFPTLWKWVIEQECIYEYCDEIVQFVDGLNIDNVLDDDMHNSQLLGYVIGIFGIGKCVNKPTGMFYGWYHDDELEIHTVTMTGIEEIHSEE